MEAIIYDIYSIYILYILYILCFEGNIKVKDIALVLTSLISKGSATIGALILHHHQAISSVQTPWQWTIGDLLIRMSVDCSHTQKTTALVESAGS